MIFADDSFQRAACPPLRLLAGLRLGIAGALLVLPTLSHAQEPAAGAATAAPSKTSGQSEVTEELIRLLIKHNALPREEAEALIRKMQQESATGAPASAAADPQQAAPASKSGDVRIIYVPADEKEKMQTEIQQKVLDTVKAENWARPDAYPDWLSRISFFGDLRVRYELDQFDATNSPFFINYQAINSGAPYDVNSTNQLLPPLLNTTEDRNMMRARARLGLTAQISDELTAGFFFTTGNATNPVSTNQTLGSDFNKVSFVIDRAYLNYRPADDWSLWLGRMPNPWLATELLWDHDLNFDGLAVRYLNAGETLSPFATIGAFPVENTAFDFPSTDFVKESSRDKWLYGAQLGTGWRITPSVEAKAGVAYYYFDKLQGETSEPLCPAFVSSIACNSDISRPGFIQRGNTLFALRDLAADPNNPNGPQYQYFGLASPFQLLDVTAKLDLAVSGPLHLLIDGEYVVNLAYDSQDVRNLAPVNNYDTGNQYDGGSRGFTGQFTFGYPSIRESGQWNVIGGYRYLESDAVVDAFTDSDFHLGGTNAKGFFVGGSLGFTHNAEIGLRWFGATEVSGAPLAVDVLQLDVNARF
jgi:hypothetical protein